MSNHYSDREWHTGFIIWTAGFLLFCAMCLFVGFVATERSAEAADRCEGRDGIMVEASVAGKPEMLCITAEGTVAE